MRILLIHQAFVSPEDSGGTRHYEFAKFCIRNGKRFTIVASDLAYLTGTRKTKKRALVTLELLDGIEVLRAYTYNALHKSFFWRLISFLSFMSTSVIAGLKAGRVDVVIGTSPPIFQGLSAWIIAAIRRVPFILEIRDLWPEFAIDMGMLRNRFLIGAARILEEFLYRRADHLIVNSPAYCEYLRSKGVPDQKISFISNGVDPEAFDPDDRGLEVRKQLGLNNCFLVTYAGALGIANAINIILEAAMLLVDDKRIHFLILGDGMERQRLKDKAQDLGIKNVTFGGSQPKSKIGKYLAASDACIATLMNIAMFQMTYPNKVFDYMAAGRPTILGIDGVIREVMETAKGGVFVHPGSAEEIADVIRRLVANPEEVEKMGKCARDYVVQNFNRKDHARLFLDLMEQYI